MANYSWLNNSNILHYIDTLSTQTKYVNLVILDNQDLPIKALYGRATGGSININGESAARRSGSITVVTEINEVNEPLSFGNLHEVSNIETLLSMNKRVSIEIGIENSGHEYVEWPLFWFPLGTFLFTNAIVSYGEQGIEITMNLMDKIALLNGEVDGVIPAAITLSPNIETNEPQLFYDIIYRLLTQFGKLQPSQFIIADIPKEITTISQITQSGNTSQAYGITSYTYPAEEQLQAAGGDSITSVLDKIKAKLGNYEYFFDINGVFHFQQIKNFLHDGSPLDNLQETIADKYFTQLYHDKATYDFTLQSQTPVLSYQNTPQYNSIKNDIHVWGKTIEQKLDLHYHLFITDSKLKKEHIFGPLEEIWPGYDNDAAAYPTADAKENYLYEYRYGADTVHTINANVWINQPLVANTTEIYRGRDPEYADYMKTNMCCSLGEWQQQFDESGKKDNTEINYWQHPPESGQIFTDGTQPFLRWIIDPSQDGTENVNSHGAQVLWNHNPDDGMGGGLPEQANIRRSIDLGAAKSPVFLCMRFRMSNTQQPFSLSYSGKTQNLHKSIQIDTWLRDNNISSNEWVTLCICLQLAGTEVEDKILDTLIFTTSFSSAVPKNTIDLSFLGFLGGTIPQGRRYYYPSSLSNLLKTYGASSEEQVLIHTRQTFSSSSYKLQVHPASDYMTQDAQSWRKQLYNIANMKRIFQQPLSSLENEVLNKLKQSWDIKLDAPKQGVEFTYWLDRIDVADFDKQEISHLQDNIKQFAIEYIGQRTTVINNDKINCIFAKKPQNITYITSDQFYQLPVIQNMVNMIKNDVKIQFINSNNDWQDFTSYLIPAEQQDVLISGLFLNQGETRTLLYAFPIQYKILTGEMKIQYSNPQTSAFEEMRSALHNYLSYNNSISLTTVPMYHLDVNQRIAVVNEEANIRGEYIINSITVPLQLDSPMTIEARRAVERI